MFYLNFGAAIRTKFNWEWIAHTALRNSTLSAQPRNCLKKSIYIDILDNMKNIHDNLMKSHFWI